MSAPQPAAARYRVIGMDCARDAAEIENAVRNVSGVQDVRVSAATHILTFRGNPPDSEVIGAVSGLGYGLQEVEDEAAASEGALPSGYRRALIIVVLLNLGYGVVEMTGGFISGSQALKADALDFLGDGMITYLGILAIGRAPRWRAGAALLQGLFLGAVGVGILAATAYRAFTQQAPDADVMGAIGIGALGVNIAAAFVLLPHRAGDTNVRAVWLFSRNDAIGNLAVVVAAVVVGLTGSGWPDLAVAVAIAALFLHSSRTIVSDAREELRSDRS